MIKKKKIKELLVEIQIENGLVGIMSKTKGVKLVIRDHDTDGCSPEGYPTLKGTEKDGYYFEQVSEAKEKV